MFVLSHPTRGPAAQSHGKVSRVSMLLQPSRVHVEVSKSKNIIYFLPGMTLQSDPSLAFCLLDWLLD